MGTPIVSDVINFAKTLAVQLGIYLKDIIKFLFTNFRFDNAIHLFLLSMFLLGIVLSLIGLFGVSAGMYGNIGFGSGRVLVGTGSGDIGSIFSEALNETDKWNVSGPGVGDLDGDGTPDVDDPDIDGDGLSNTQDYDVDGDGIPNEDDPSPCGPNIPDCNIPYPTLCGNGVCDIFLTNANFYTLPSIIFSDCSDLVMCYDLPAFCLHDSPGTYLWHQWAGTTVFSEAVCGLSSLRNDYLNPRCIVDSDFSGLSPVYDLWYIETVANCPIDCNISELDCMKDWTCDLVDHCADHGLFCCPPGTYHHGRCTDCYIHTHCNDPSSQCIVGSGYSLVQLRSMPTNCECSSDRDCINDFGGDTCCPSGTHHEGFCYPGLSCDVV